MKERKGRPMREGGEGKGRVNKGEEGSIREGRPMREGGEGSIREGKGQ